MTESKSNKNKMIGRIPYKDYLRIRRIGYWLRTVLKELESLSPEAREEFGKVIGDNDLKQFRDLETLEKVLKKMSFS